MPLGYRKEDLAAGTLIQRKGGFWEQGEALTTVEMDFRSIWAEIKRLLPDESANATAQFSTETVKFEGAGWTARLSPIGATAETKSYKFVFTSWQASGNTGSVSLSVFWQMNRTLTAVEKAFLVRDPYTVVRRVRVHQKSKSQFF